ncbi:esterase [Corynebacterium sp. TAE3-ERU12]|uniref:GDSL-type esterase/lipase family protein n=1 Tax=Corynebacterium sp. TAE3-ERU12 TaxID=2849491 RepID=UPI001C44557B|nr:GDSL-type esterase/lipase family protein [Corynebacterium sp. TAE3-ERU12]MBV7294633.1 esterase [Corynebacterium sp. TAE3-ERU12]
MKKNLLASARATAVAALSVIGLSLGAATAAAQPPLPPLPAPPAVPGLPPINMPENPDGAKQIVAFGDSFTANAGKGGPRGLEAGQVPWVANCATDMENWPKVAAAKLNKSIGDWSCNGTGGMPIVQLKAYVESAIAYGDLGPGTEKVVLMYGGMDAVQWMDVAGVMTGQVNTNPTMYRALIGDVVTRVNQVAPGAEVVLASYPEYAMNDQLCLVNFPDQINPIPAPGGTQIQQALRDSIRLAAEANGAKFIDVYEATIGHGTCNPDPNQRYTAGFVDPAIGPMPNHPTVVGEKAMGDIIASQLF